MATPELIKKLDGMIHLRKLELVNLKSKDGRRVCESIQSMEHLSTLGLRAESGEYLELAHIQDKPGFEFLRHLYLEGHMQKFPRWVSSLAESHQSRPKVVEIKHRPLQSLQGLPNLMELYMVDAFTGQTRKFEANTFKKLKILSIEHLSELSMVPVQVNAMPALEKLTFSKCEKLNMLTRLQELLLCDMNREFINRLRKNSEDRNLVSHDRDIHSYTLGEDQLWVRHNLP